MGAVLANATHVACSCVRTPPCAHAWHSTSEFSHRFETLCPCSAHGWGGGMPLQATACIAMWPHRCTWAALINMVISAVASYTRDILLAIHCPGACCHGSPSVGLPYSCQGGGCIMAICSHPMWCMLCPRGASHLCLCGGRGIHSAILCVASGVVEKGKQNQMC